MTTAPPAEDVRLLREIARSFLQARRASPNGDAAPGDGALWREMADLGWDRLTVPSAWGGGGGSWRQACVLAEETGRALSALPFVPATLAVAAISRDGAGSPALLERFAGARPAVVLEAGARAFGRPPAGARPGAGGDWILDGADLLGVGAGAADVLVVPASCGGRVAVAVVDAAAPGVRRRDLVPSDATRPLATVTLEGVAVGGDAVLGPCVDRGPLDAGSPTAGLVDRAAVLLAAESLGVARAALEAATGHARTRRQFGRPIGAYQAVAHALATVAVEVEHAESLVWHAAGALDDDAVGAPVAASMAKLYATRTARNATAAAIQVHGGLGFSWESTLHLYFKRAKANQALFGTSDWHADRIAALSGWAG